MNYLAHLFLSCSHEDHLIGNFIADSISRNPEYKVNPDIKEGIDLHKRIDSFTDNHPIVRKSRERLYYAHSKYSSVIVDVWYDYLLAKNWTLYTDESLDNFVERMYAILFRRLDDLPKKLQNSLPYMVQDNFLMKYTNLFGMTEVFRRLRKRFSRPEYLNDVVKTFLVEEENLNNDFNQFFPELKEFVKQSHVH